MTVRLITAATLCLLAMAIGVTAPGSATARIRCGATITKHTKLHHDLHCKRRIPIKIGTDHVILDLNGHEVEREPHRSRSGAAIVNKGHDRVTITNGKVTSRGARGVLFKHADANRLVRTKVTATNGRDAVALAATTRTIVRSNEIVSRGDGWPVVVKAGSSDNKIAHNDASGILIGRPHDDDVSSGNRVWFNFVHAGRGIYVRGGSAIQTSVGTNRVIENDRDGILVTSPSTSLASNRANRNSGHGINAVAGVTDFGRNRARGNLLSPQCINVVCG